MINEQHQEQASLYAIGVLSPSEAEQFGNALESDPQLRQLATALSDAGAALPLAFAAGREPSPGLKSRIMRQIADRETASLFNSWCRPGEALVVADKDGLIEWVNDAFTQMCGFKLDELRGRKPGSMLQGTLTDRGTVQRIREAIRARRPVNEDLVNYTKDGQPYWVSISITPILDERCEPRRFVAVEREIAGRAFA